MATIYRFIVENRSSGGNGSGRKSDSSSAPRKATAKGKWVSALKSGKGGVEHNRKMRAINPLLNRATGGYWEKGMRLGRAGLGLIQRNTETGALRVSGTALTIIIALIVTSFLKIQRKNIAEANKQNAQNYKSMEVGISAVHGQYNISRNYWNGKMSYNENK